MSGKVTLIRQKDQEKRAAAKQRRQALRLKQLDAANKTATFVVAYGSDDTTEQAKKSDKKIRRLAVKELAKSLGHLSPGARKHFARVIYDRNVREARLEREGKL